jgi:soluble lytic murein transglycosylase
LPLWLTLLEPPEPCYPVLEALIIDKRVLADAVWARIRRQFEANKIAAALYTMNYLPASQTPDKKLAQTVIDAPLPWLIRLPGDFSGSRMQRELAAWPSSALPATIRAWRPSNSSGSRDR